MKGCATVAWLALALGAAAQTRPSPSRVLVLGDSLMQLPAHALELEISKRGGIETRAFTRIGSGLARLDVYDWIARFDELKTAFNPDTVLVFMGANDRQPMRTDDGVIQPGDAAWVKEYGRRIGEAMDLLIGEEGARVLWFELPDMREAAMQEDVNLINTLIAAEADRRPEADVFPTRPVLSRTPGRYSPYILRPNGMPLHVRSSDHIHLNRQGADLLAQAVVRFLWNE